MGGAFRVIRDIPETCKTIRGGLAMMHVPKPADPSPNCMPSMVALLE